MYGKDCSGILCAFFDWKMLRKFYQGSLEVADVARQFLGFGSVLVFHQGISF